MNAQTIQIKSTEIIQLILQFLQQNSTYTIIKELQKTFKTLQQQSGTTLNQINSKNLLQSFHNQQWTQVIELLSNLMLPQQYQFELYRLFFSVYQYISDSLIEKDQFQAASYLVQQVVKPNTKEDQTYRQRIMRLEYIIEHPNEKNLYKRPPTPERQDQLIKQIVAITSEAQPSRLIKLLTQSLKYQANEGLINPSIALNLFTNIQEEPVTQVETIIKQIQKTIAYSQQSKITEIKLSWSEQFLAIAGIDGLIELYNTKDYSLYQNQYQKEGNMFFHDHPINLMQFNYTDQMLASCDSTGLVNIWNLANGKLLRKIDKQSKINAMCWGIDPSHFLVGYKESIKLYGIRSCNVLKQYISNSPQFISDLFVSDSRLYCVTSSGSLTIFNYSSQEQLFNFQMKQPVVSVTRLFKDNLTHLFDKVLLSYKKRILEIDQFGTQSKGYPILEGQLQNASSKGVYLYMCVKGNDGKFRLNVIQRANKSMNSKSNQYKTVFYMSLQSGFQKMVMSRKRNLLITYDEKHKLSFWRPL